ncbi:unnamed protein product [Caenorhabditis angaria]|uniref:7TM GPCR serpentine receptor class x (Srx) domain-containing protein n=1 Tax=Caenorhabditis angaria TaxID=860376 RepID=A0A9P1IX63_9PELO|nr:unnamed protein product [Caenorhabditis angaria]
MDLFWFRMFAAFSMFISAVLGLFFNVLVILALQSPKKLGGIFKICIAKSISNIIICVGFLVWPIPIAILNYYFLPQQFNVFMGQIVGWFAITLAPLTQVLLAGNRLIAVYFPQTFGNNYKISPTSIGISIAFFVASIAAIAGFFDGCHFLFMIESLGWTSENSACAILLSNMFTIVVFSMAFVSNSLNIATFFKLFYDSKKANISNNEVSNRRSKNRRMLLQSVLHDLLILIDMCNAIFICQLSNSIWVQFLTLSFSMVFIRMLEGLAMLLINVRIRNGALKILKIRKKQIGTTRQSSQQSIGNQPAVMFKKV